MEKTCNFPCLLLFPLLLVHTSSTTSMAATNLTTDESALLALKAHITFDPDSILERNWSTSTATSVCEWIGVTCGSSSHDDRYRHHRVTALNMSNMGVTGTIPSQFGNLSFLVYLNLGYNNFHGQLPEGMTRLRRLRYIFLTHNFFSGRIPAWFGRGFFPKLQLLNLTTNSFTGSIPTSIFNSSGLEIIGFSDNHLSGTLPSNICQHLPNLRRFHVSVNMLYGQITTANLSQCSALRKLSLSFNLFTGNIPREIGKLKSLEMLDIGGNNFHGIIPAEIGDLSNLKVFVMRYCNIIGFIPREIGNLIQLEYLDLGNNNLVGAIPDEIGNLHHLRVLLIHNTTITGSIPSGLFNLTKLQQVFMANNSLTGTLPENLCSGLPNLVKLFLHRNNLHGQIPIHLGICSSLRILSLEENKFTGAIPREIGNLTTLQNLFLRHNYLTGSIPQELGNLHRLEDLYLGFNHLSGSLPVGIFNISTLFVISIVGSKNLKGNLPLDMGYKLPNLEELYLGDNSLSGVIPVSISNSSQLSRIDLGLNHFHGSIPNSLGELRFLEHLRLFDNNLTSEPSSAPELSFISYLSNCRSLNSLILDGNLFDATLPATIGNLSASIEFLYLSSCKIRGSIPQTLGNLSNLLSVDLSNNDLTGSFPKLGLQKLQGLYLSHNHIEGILQNDLCEMTSLNDLNLSQNSISGSLPECLGNVTSLRHISLSSNRLSSSLPTRLWNLKDLLELTVASNELTGTLPLQVGNLKAVKLLDLSRNQIFGNIPSSIGGLQNLIEFSLANNHLDGPIPTSFSGLVDIEAMDLSHNNLSGLIPNSMEALISLKRFNVSFNGLSGEIPSGGPFRSFSWSSFIFNRGLCGEPRFSVPKCRVSASRSRTKRVLRLGFIILGVLVITISMGWGYVFLRCRRKGKVSNGKSEVLMTTERISYYELLQATNGYQEINLLGKGSFGSVYQGILNDGRTVAVKVFNFRDGIFKSFDVECEVLKILRHRNLVRVITSCSTPDFKALVLEFMSQGSLEKWLYSHNCFLDVSQRLNIMIQVANALHYLHRGSSTPVVHCDLKPSNILLDQDLVARVSDFGIAKLLSHEESIVYTETVATMGYVAPEYGFEGQVSTKCDIYSFGIILMEVFTRRKPSDEMFNGDLSLRNWVSGYMPNGLIISVIDSNLLRSFEEQLAEVQVNIISSIMEVALDCTTDSPRDRKSIEEVLSTLHKIESQLSSCFNRRRT